MHVSISSSYDHCDQPCTCLPLVRTALEDGAERGFRGRPLCNAIDHIFLPRRPQGRQDSLHEMELFLLKLFNEVVETIRPEMSKRLFANMKQLHCAEALNPKTISQQLGNLQRGEMLGIYVRAQNCGLFIHMARDEPSDDVTLGTFSASLPNETIYGDSINGDIQVKILTQFEQQL